MSNSIDATVTVTYTRLRELETTIETQQKTIAQKEDAIRNLESKQSQVLIRKKDWHLIATISDRFPNGYSVSDHAILLNLRNEYGKQIRVYANAFEINDLVRQLNEKYQIVVEKEVKEYVHLDTVRDELRAELSEKIRKEFSDRIAKTDADKEMLDKKLARQDARHIEEIERVKQENRAEIVELNVKHQSKVAELEARLEDKKQQTEMEKLRETIQSLHEELHRLKSSPVKPWWKFW